MKVAIVYQYYQGHEAPGHSLVFELTHFLAARGHQVSVVSGESGYMQQDAPALPWYRRLLRREMRGQVSVLRTFSVRERNRSVRGRVLSLLSFTLSCPFGLLAVGKVDVVLASSPPLFPAFTAWLVCRLRRIPYVIEVRDLWPASGVQMGLVRSRRLIAVMTWIESLLYRRARKIVALTAGIRSDICRRGWDPGKVEVVTCGVDFATLYPDPEAGATVRRQYASGGKRLVLYFGALGEANDIPVILRAAARLRADAQIVFLLVGDGLRRADAERVRGELGLDNVQILPPVPKNMARAYINAADVCLATLRDLPLFEGAIPTKLIDYMACGKPVLCTIRGEAARLVQDAGAGLVISPEDDADLAQGIVDLLRDPERAGACGRRGLDFVLERFSAAQMRQKMEGVLQEACGEAGPAVRS